MAEAMGNGRLHMFGGSLETRWLIARLGRLDSATVVLETQVAGGGTMVWHLAILFRLLDIVLTMVRGRGVRGLRLPRLGR